MTDHQEFRAKAEAAATAGTWYTAGTIWLLKNSGPDGAFIEAASPKTIIALLDEIEALRAAIDEGLFNGGINQEGQFVTTAMFRDLAMKAQALSRHAAQAEGVE